LATELEGEAQQLEGEVHEEGSIYGTCFRCLNIITVILSQDCCLIEYDTVSEEPAP
jgi:hypothetical protein